MNKQDAFPIEFQMTLDGLEAIDRYIHISVLSIACLLILCGCSILLNA